MNRTTFLMMSLFFLVALPIDAQQVPAADPALDELRYEIQLLQNRVQELETQLQEQEIQKNQAPVEQSSAMPEAIPKDDWFQDPFGGPSTSPGRPLWHHRGTDAFDQLFEIQRKIERMFENDFGLGRGSYKKMGTQFNPQIDISETDSQYIFKIDLPGMDKESIKVEVKNRILIISGERSSAVEEQTPDRFYRQERSFGHFSRALTLPNDVKPDEVTAEYDKGVLIVKIGKEEKSVESDVGTRIPVY